jgi:hypothetical protein|tara:strand:- start:443 stop:646 length:204 start_codon:yes stop_codon:yes gene_type:complete
MTKKDYEKVARIIGKLTANNCESLTKQNLINEFVSLFNEDNHRFSTKMFEKACELSRDFNNITAKAR